MSEFLPAPVESRFPSLDRDPDWVRVIPAGTLLTRIYRSRGTHPTEWSDFREYGPLDGRFDPHPGPVGPNPGVGVMYTVLEGRASARSASDSELPTDPLAEAIRSPFAAALLEVFQAQRMIRRSLGGPVLAMFETARPVRLLDLAESDWVTVAGGNSSIASGDRAQSRAWARAITSRYPELDGVVSASSLIPSARIGTLWSPAQTALPTHPHALIPLDRDELTGVIDAIADRYGYVLV